MEAQQRSDAAQMQMQFEHNDVDNLAGESQPEPRNQNQGERANGQMRVNVAGGVAAAGLNGADAEPNPYASMNISRNALCPCGSALKYKQCHGKI